MNIKKPALFIIIFSVMLFFGVVSCGEKKSSSSSIIKSLKKRFGKEKNDPKWYVAINGKTAGPYTLEELKTIQFTSETYFCPEGSEKWVRAKELPEIMALKQTYTKAPAKKKKKRFFFGRFIHINSSNPGQRISINDYIQEGYINIFDFYSKYCGPCKIVARRLKKLLDKRKDIVVNEVDIDRREANGIDFHSPLAQQYNIQYVPNFYIYYPDTRQWLMGEAAYSRVLMLLRNEGV